MFRVMVADDEPKIRHGLCKLIESMNDLPLTICAQAEDGEEAMELALKHSPDIILLDICMPHVDGLSFLSTLRKNSKNAKCIIITGYDELAYAQACLTLKAHAYMLKPVKHTELKQYLVSAIEELENDNANSKLMQNTLNQLQRNKDTLYKHFVKQWLNGSIIKADIEEELLYWNIDCPDDAYLLILRLDLPAQRFSNQKEKQLMLFASANIVEEWLRDIAQLEVILVCHDDELHVLTILKNQIDENQCDDLITALDDYLEITSIAFCTKMRNKELAEAFKYFEDVINNQKIFPENVTKFISFIENNFVNPDLSLIDVSNILGFSGAHLSRLVKQHFGVSFSKYLTLIRIEEAKRLLLDPETKIVSIAQQVGYMNQHYFSTSFRKATGLSPSQYRERGCLS